MRVLLVGPDYEENLSIRYLSASLLSAGHETTLAPFNTPTDTMPVANAAQHAEIVGLSMCFQSRAQEFLHLAQLIKSHNPEKLLVAGGHYASCAAEPLLTNHPEIDIIAIHEGERTLVEIADSALRLEERLPQIPGVAYRDGQRVRFTTPRPVLDDLDTLPFPDRRGAIHSLAGVPTSYLMGSRGCYGRCAYCCITTLHRIAPGKRFRQRHVERIADEMSALYHERGTRQFVFHDDNFLVPSEAVNLARLSAFSKALKSRGVGDIALVIKCRPADANREVLWRLKDLGLVRVFLGVESATAQGLSVLQRNQSVEESERALEACSELDISAQFTLMVFNPATTLDTLRADVTFMRCFCGNPLNFCRTEIYAGTPLETRMMELGRARGNYLAREYDLSDPVANLACNVSLDLFDARCWNTASLMQRTIGLDHLAAVAKRFYAGPRRVSVCKQVARWVRSVNKDTIDLLEEVIETSASATGTRDAGFQRALSGLRERESSSRQEFISEGSKLRSELEGLRFANKGSQFHQFPGARLRLTRQVATALLAVGIPALSGCNRSQDHNLDTPPPAPAPHPLSGIAEMAARPLQESKTTPPVPAKRDNLCSLKGTITDAAGSAVANAEVTIKNTRTGLVRRLRTDTVGRYAVDDLHAGRYSVTVSAPGFATAKRSRIVLKTGSHQRADFVLKITNWGCCEYAPAPLKPKDAEPPVLKDVEPPLPLSIEVRTPPPLPPEVQGTLGSLAGTVTDRTGAIIPSATITITNVGTGQVRRLKTNESGQYLETDLPDGQYTVMAQVQGYSETKKAGIVLKAGDHKSGDLALKIVVNLTLQ